MKYVLSVLMFLQAAAQANIKLPAIISDHMVLQQNSRAMLWGFAAPFSTVTVQASWSKKVYSVRSNEAGAWQVLVHTSKAGGPYEMVFNDSLVVHDVLIGEVWLCSGQSNMVMPLKGYDKGQDVLHGPALIDSADQFPQIRLFDVAKKIAATPADDCQGAWKVSTSKNAPGFSAIAFQFAMRLQRQLKVPVGMITSCWGSTAIQSWMPNLNGGSTRPDTMKVPAANPEALTAGLFNAMIYPLHRFTLRGFLWYQGESNKDAALYQRLLPVMVRTWRSLWGPLPFYYVQIAPYNYKDRNTAYLREAQLKATIKNAGMAVSLDAGVANRIHPPDKTTISDRLARWALGHTYHIKGIVYRSPVCTKVKYKNGTARLQFSQALQPRAYAYFEVAGNDKVFYPAKAVSTGSHVIQVSSDRVRQPVAVRYAFTNWVQGDLFSTAGLPASSFQLSR